MCSSDLFTLHLPVAPERAPQKFVCGEKIGIVCVEDFPKLKRPRFALDHLGMDDEFWARLRAGFTDPEITDLTIACGMFLGLGRALAVVDVAAPEQHLLV